MAHTPGPWNIQHEFNIFGADGRSVASCGGHYSNVDSDLVHEENCVNARLIAAAPDLLEACKDIAREEAEWAGDGWVELTITTEQFRALKVAIAKATGDVDDRDRSGR